MQVFLRLKSKKCGMCLKIYGETYSQVIEETGLDYQTLRNYKYVASRIELSLRKDNLHWHHHLVVAPLEPDQQEHYRVFHTAKCYITVVMPLTCPFAPFARYSIAVMGACRAERARMRKCPMSPTKSVETNRKEAH